MVIAQVIIPYITGVQVIAYEAKMAAYVQDKVCKIFYSLLAVILSVSLKMDV